MYIIIWSLSVSHRLLRVQVLGNLKLTSSGRIELQHICLPSTHIRVYMGRDGALVESKPFDRRVVGSNPALAAT